MTFENIDDNIKKLFLSLINETPAVITANNTLVYNVNGELINIWWIPKREDHLKSSTCDQYYKQPFNRSNEEIGLFLNTWKVDTSKLLDGYTFYINTPICQFKVPELSRRDLVDIQEKIERHFENFIPNYLEKLLTDASNCMYGKVKSGTNIGWKIKE